jgi:predicted DNA-binding transcriptional regulator AlpA
MDVCSSTTSQEIGMPILAHNTTYATHPGLNPSATFLPGERRVLNEIELAQRWGVSPKSLQRWRSEGRGPRYLKLSKRVGYPLDVIVEFERQALHESTSGRFAPAVSVTGGAQ